MAKKPDCKRVCVAVRKAYRPPKPIPCGDENGNIARCPYVPRLWECNIPLWRMYCAMRGEPSVENANTLCEWHGVARAKRPEVLRLLTAIRAEFEAVAEEKRKAETFDKQLGNYKSGIRGKR